jgi:hypothetical protein
MLARTIAAIVVEVEQLAGRLQDMEQQLARELLQYRKDPSQGARQGVSPIKVCCHWLPGAASHDRGKAVYRIRGSRHGNAH